MSFEYEKEAMSFKDEKEAERVRRRRSNVETEKFCPLIEDNCTSFCVCYSFGGVEMFEGEYHLSNPGCNNPMLIR